MQWLSAVMLRVLGIRGACLVADGGLDGWGPAGAGDSPLAAGTRSAGQAVDSPRPGAVYVELARRRRRAQIAARRLVSAPETPC